MDEQWGSISAIILTSCLSICWLPLFWFVCLFVALDMYTKLPEGVEMFSHLSSFVFYRLSLINFNFFIYTIIVLFLGGIYSLSWLEMNRWGQLLLKSLQWNLLPHSKIVTWQIASSPSVPWCPGLAWLRMFSDIRALILSLNIDPRAVWTHLCSIFRKSPVGPWGKQEYKWKALRQGEFHILQDSLVQKSLWKSFIWDPH